jgi:hypothetical protein
MSRPSVTAALARLAELRDERKRWARDWFKLARLQANRDRRRAPSPALEVRHVH